MKPVGGLRLLVRALVQRLLPARPVGLTAYYTEALPARLAAARWQLERSAPGAVLEIGAGRDLHPALLAAVAYGRPATASDIVPLAELPLVNFTLAGLGSPLRLGSLAELARLGVRYSLDPHEHRRPGYAAFISTAAFEHIPEPVLHDIFAHAQANGVATVTAEIDLQDHWSYIEPVPPDAFHYRGRLAWAVLNNRRMWQNRLRWPDYVRLAAGHGYRLAACELRRFPAPPDRRRLAARFRGYRDEDLAISGALALWERAEVSAGPAAAPCSGSAGS